MTGVAETGDRGSASLELAILAPALLLLLCVVIMAGRVESGGGAVEQAAASAARAASLARDATSARAAAGRVVSAAVVREGLACSSTTWDIDTSGFSRPVGESGSVTVVVRCELSLADLAAPGIPGSRQLEARATSPVDPYRMRS